MSIDGPDGPFIHLWYLEIQKNDKNERYSFLRTENLTDISRYSASSNQILHVFIMKKI